MHVAYLRVLVLANTDGFSIQLSVELNKLFNITQNAITEQVSPKPGLMFQ